MNIYQQQLENNEIELIKKVLDYTFIIGSTKVCFKDIEDKLILDLSIPENNKYETISIDNLLNELKKLEKEIDVFKNAGEKTYGDYINYKLKIEGTIKNGGKIEIPVLGSFNSTNQKVYLYLKTLGNYADDVKIITEPLVTTFVHEMFHAWNYFASNSHERTVEEIDEAMVECYTLLFLQDISRSMPEFEPIFEWAKGDIQDKQSSIGKQSAYGFGYYLFSLWNTKDSGKLQKMIKAYCRRSGRINNQSDLVKNIQGKFTTTYPRSEEESVFELFYNVIIAVEGQVWDSEGKTNIVNNKGELLFEEYVEKIEPLYEGQHRIDGLILVENKGLYNLYYYHYGAGVWYPLFKDLFMNYIKETYGKEDILLVRDDNNECYIMYLFDILDVLHELRKKTSHTIYSISVHDLRRLIMADDLLKSDDSIFYAKKGESLGCIFHTKNREKPVVVEDVNGAIHIGDGHLTIVQYIKDSLQFVVYNNYGDILSDEFDNIYDIDSECLIVEKEGKFNYYDTKNHILVFDKWFDDVEPFDEEKMSFKVCENGIWKLFDRNGRDVSIDFQEELS